MSLINIEYGSIASSEIINKNFLYLENNLNEKTISIINSISSILSNIATINSTIRDLSTAIQDISTELSSKIESDFSKTKVFFNKLAILPDWNNKIPLSGFNSYKPSLNGLLIIRNCHNLAINGTIIKMSGEISIFVSAGDLITNSDNFTLEDLYIPTKALDFENI